MDGFLPHTAAPKSSAVQVGGVLDLPAASLLNDETVHIHPTHPAEMHHNST